MIKYSIGITTFALRIDFLVKLVGQIREYSDKKIFICINGEIESKFDDKYRTDVLNLCLKHHNVYPIFFVEIRGLSKMWNTLLSHSECDDMLLLNDDIEIKSNDLFNKLENITNNKLTKINNSFSHFLVNRKIIEEIGWFDEKLLGFGEEDGDITYRLIEHNIPILNLYVSNVINIVSDIRQNLINGIGKYSKYNRDYIFGEKYEEGVGGVIGMFGTSHVRKIQELFKPLPLEKFFWDNKSKLYK